MSFLLNPFVFAGAAGDFESIATVTASGSAASVEFTSIPSTFTHLQIRGIARNSQGNTYGALRFRLNGDTGSNYSKHYLRGSGSAAQAGGGASGSYIDDAASVSGNNATADVMGAVIIDILDYADTSKFTTVRIFSGHDNNGDGYVVLGSGLWQSTSAVTSFLIEGNATNLTADTTLALYGIHS